jgi:hypothetical protein
MLAEPIRMARKEKLFDAIGPRQSSSLLERHWDWNCNEEVPDWQNCHSTVQTTVNKLPAADFFLNMIREHSLRLYEGQHRTHLDRLVRSRIELIYGMMVANGVLRSEIRQVDIRLHLSK